jgi:hypothetical protein
MCFCLIQIIFIYININEFINRSKFIIDKNSDNEIYFNKTMNINPLIISVRNNLLKRSFIMIKIERNF